MPHTLQATATEDPIQYQCRHIKPDGHRCGSPSLRAQNFCFYHEKARRPGPRQPQVTTATARKNSTFDLPSPADLSDRSGIQLAVALLLHKIAHNEIDPRRAGLLLYGLQTAAMLLPKETKITNKGGRSFKGRRDFEADTHLEAGPVEDITEDPIHGPLAPPAELGENEPESVLSRWVREMREQGEADRLAKQAKAEAAAQTTPANPATPAEPTPANPLYLTAAAHRPNRACRRQALKQRRKQPKAHATPATLT